MSPASSGGKIMRRISLIGFTGGLALLIGLVLWQGTGIISDALSRVGWQVFWLPVFFLIPLGSALLSWWYLFPRDAAPSLKLSSYCTWINYSVNWLLPVAQVGGEIVRVRLLLKRQVEAAMAIATVIGDQTLQILSQAIYALVGITLLMWVGIGPGQASGQLVGLVLGSLVVLALISYAFYWVQHKGIFNLLAKVARKFPNLSDQPLSESGPQLDIALKQMYQRRDRLVISCLWRLAFRFTAAGETWLALYFLGHPVSIADAIILESIGQAVRSAAFFIPGGLGAQEGGLILVGTALGIPMEVALTMSLCKRIRELTLGVPGLIALQVEEGMRAIALFRRD
ncbi:MAG: flippase-like domain-containing protein [Synechococcales bacterium]|nr:flippase-like domain-containing protein [Synechococcales bacterium]